LAIRYKFTMAQVEQQELKKLKERFLEPLPALPATKGDGG